MVDKKVKHIPMRTCIVTREKLPKSELVRFVYLADEQRIVFDPKGGARGRGANLKKSLDIFDQAVQSNAFARAFKTKVDPDKLTPLREELAKYLEREKLGSGSDKVTVRVKVDDKVKLD